jgi:S1-C subfamily serine protease
MTRFFILALTTMLPFFTGARSATGEQPEEVRTRAAAATVQVTSADDHEFGSGVAIARDKLHTYFLTAAHILTTAKTVEVKLASGKTYLAEVIERSDETDLAVLRMPSAEKMPVLLKLAAGGVKPKSFSSVGWEKGAAPTSLEEKLKEKVRLKKPGEKNSVLCWEIERKPAGGRSGGPLVDETGRVVGVATGHDGTAGYYVHIDEIHAFLQRTGLEWLAEEERR